MLVASGTIHANAATTYYVSATSGNDAWSGTLAAPNSANTDGPFETLNKAKTAMEGSSIKTTTIESGTYSIVGSSLTFGSNDSGETWIPLQNAAVMIDGGGSGYMSATRATGLTVEGFTIQNLGQGPVGAGFYLNGSSYTIRWNTFLNCYINCLSGSNVQSALIDSNTMNGQGPGNPPGNIGQAFSAIQLWYGSSNNSITHNLIENIQGGGIDLDDGPSDPPINNNIIDRNLLKSVTTNVVDMGALYLYDESGSSTGNQITNNTVLGGGNPVNSTKCIYLDGSVSNVLVKGNICAHQSGGQPDEYSVFIHGGRNNNITNNILEAQQLANFTDYWGNTQNGGYLGAVQSDTGITDGSGNSFTHNIVFSPGSWPSPSWQLLTSGYPKPSASYNDYYSMTGESVSQYGVTDSSPFTDNPLFTNPQGDNYTIGAGSAVYTDISWQSLPTDQGPLVNPFGALTDTSAPSIPTGLTASPISSSQINLSWTASSDPDNTASQITYNVYRGGVKVGAGAAGVTSYSDTGLAANTTYSYSVSASDPSGNTSAQSASVSATTQGITAAPIHWWKFDDGSGMTAADSAGNAPGTLSGATWTSGKSGGAVAVGGKTNGHVTMAANLPSTFTLTFWAKANGYNANDQWGNVILAGENYLTNGFRCGFTTAGTFVFWTNQSGGTLWISSYSPAAIGTWNHYAVVYSNGLASLYMNGFLTTINSGILVPDNGGMGVDAGAGAVGLFNGSLDDLRIYNQALSASQIQNIYGNPP
jgi:hypothetical protein